LRGALRAVEFDVVHGLWAHEPGALAAWACRATRTPLVVSLLGGELVALRDIRYGGALESVNRRLARHSLAAAAVVTIGSEALRGLAVEPPKVSLAHMALRFPPVSQFLERFRAVLRARRVFDFDTETSGLARVEQAVAFLALLELRKAGEVALSQAAPFAPIRVSRADDERILAWRTVRSA
jgi:hypothetical protein